MGIWRVFDEGAVLAVVVVRWVAGGGRAGGGLVGIGFDEDAVLAGVTCWEDFVGVAGGGFWGSPFLGRGLLLNGAGERKIVLRRGA